MNESLDQILSGFIPRVGEWVSRLEDANSGLQELQESVEAHAGLLTTASRRELLRAVETAKENVLAQRRRQAAESIAKACREHLIRLEPGRPLRRKPKKAAQTAAAEVVSAPARPTGEGSAIVRDGGSV